MKGTKPIMKGTSNLKKLTAKTMAMREKMDKPFARPKGWIIVSIT